MESSSTSSALFAICKLKHFGDWSERTSSSGKRYYYNEVNRKQMSNCRLPVAQASVEQLPAFVTVAPPPASLPPYTPNTTFYDAIEQLKSGNLCLASELLWLAAVEQLEELGRKIGVSRLGDHEAFGLFAWYIIDTPIFLPSSSNCLTAASNTELVNIGFKKLEDDLDGAAYAFWSAAVGQLKLLRQQHGVSEQLGNTKALYSFTYYLENCVKDKDERLAKEISIGWNAAQRCDGCYPKFRLEANYVGEEVKRFVELLQSQKINSIQAIKEFKFK